MNEQPDVMRELSAYMAAAADRPLPADVAEKTKHHLLDTLAAMVSGSRLLPGEKAISFARSVGGGADAVVVGSDLVTDAITAALANGMLAHSDETDDSHAPSLTHPGCGIVPAALAMAERRGSAGAALLTAIALGYDIGCRVTMALDANTFHEDGHSTHSFGPTFGAAAAAGSLARLDARGMRHLLSYCAQQASGLSCWMRDEEHVEKAFDFGGMPARNGITAALMVAHGFSGVDDVFSGPKSFFAAYGRAPDPQMLTCGLGTTFEIMRTNIKRWTVGSPIQAPLDSLEALIRAHTIRADDVERMVVRVSHQGAATVNNRTMPDICMQHLCAVMLVDGTVSFASSHDEARMHDPRILAVRERIELHGDDELSSATPARQGIVELHLRDGRALVHRTRVVHGTSDSPMSREEIGDKAHDLMQPVLGPDRSRALCEAVWQLEGIRDLRDLRPLLTA